MSKNFNYTGIKISQYPYAEVNTSNHKNKLEHRHYFMSYAATNYGISDINKNFQVPVDVLRDDMMGYIGIQNSKPGWRDYINIWEGDWYNSDDVRSYVYQWDANTELHKPDYIYNKHGLDTSWDKKNSINRIYMLKTAPWPLEATDSHFSSLAEKNYGYDPNPHSVKFVSKDYIDDRHNGFRKIDVQDYGKEHPSHLSIRPYTCFYQYSNLPEQDENGCYFIDICDDCVLEDGSLFKDKVKHNRLMFYLRIKNNQSFYENNGVHCNNLKITSNGRNEVLWSYEDEWTEILREHRLKNVDGVIQNTQKEYIFLRCEAEYINDTFTVTCSNFFGRKKAIKRMVEITVDENGIIDLDLSLHENEAFVTQVPYDSILSDNTRPQIVINFDTSKLDDYHMYSWDYFLITGDNVIDKEDINNPNLLDYCEVVFGGTPILWANNETYNVQPDFQPNKMYCIEFVKAFDGLLIGRIKYYISLIKKA